MPKSISILKYQAPDGDASFVEFLGPLLEADGTRWLLHLEPSAFLGSAAIGALIRWHRRLQTRDGVVVLVQAGGSVRRVLRMLGLEGVLRVFETEEEAIAELGGAHEAGDETVALTS